SASASLRVASNVADCEPGATRNRIGRRVYSIAVVLCPDWFLACRASSTSFSLSCRLDAKRPRTSCCQTESARMRVLSVCGLTPPFCRFWVSWSADWCIRLAMFAYMVSTSASVSSMPQRLPSRILSLSSMSSLITSGRTACFWVDRASLNTAKPRNARAARASAERAEAELEHERLVVLRGRRSNVIIEFCDVIQGQDKAIVNISQPDLGLGHLLGPQVVAHRSQH